MILGRALAPSGRALRGSLGPQRLPPVGTPVARGASPFAGRRAIVMAAAADSVGVPAVVSPQWLAERLGRGDVKVLDVSWYLPPMGRDKIAEHQAARIPGARFWDVDGVCDPASDLPHMLPSEAAFAAAADALGVGNGDTLVLYDGMGLFSSPRAWWTWKVFGHERVTVLEGGLPAWKAAGLATEAGPVPAEQLHAATAAARAPPAGGAAYVARLQRDKVVPLDQMRALVAGGSAQVADARPPGRFKGVDPEPRPGLRRGHMPGAKSVPFTQMYVGGDMAGARLKSPAELQAAFSAAGVDVSQPLVCTCGSGLTACVLALGAHTATGGSTLPAVYDGSWSEWGALQDTPVVAE